MESEVSSISKLGIVLIALAILIGLGFGIFQISKSTANKGVGDVQQELDSVSSSTFSTYDQTNITGTMVKSAVSDFEGESVAVLIANQAWKNCLNDAKAKVGDYDEIVSAASGMSTAYVDSTETNGTMLPIVWAYKDSKFNEAYPMTAADGTVIDGAFINYNAIIGGTGDTQPSGTTTQTAKFNGESVYMAGIYFDSNCWRCDSGFASGSAGKVLFNNIVGNLSKTGRTEYIPSGAKFESYLIKDSSGTNMGVVFEQIGA